MGSVTWGCRDMGTSPFCNVDLGPSLWFGVISMWRLPHLGSLGFGVIIAIWGHHWDLGSSLFGAIIGIWGHLYVATSAFGVVGIWGHLWDVGSSLFRAIIGIWGHLCLGPSLGLGAISLWGH